MKTKRIGTRAYIKTLLKDPSVASVTPTSQYGIKKLLSGIDFPKCNLIVEYGPGGGVITKVLLSKTPPHCKIVAIEQNKDFANTLRSEVQDERLIVVNDSAEFVSRILDSLHREGEITTSKADHIISGIPFSMFPVDLKERILSSTKNALKQNGSFLVYQFLLSLSAGKNDIKRKIRDFFDISRSVVELRNVPPLRIFEGFPKHK